MKSWHKSLALTAFILIAIALLMGVDKADVPPERVSSVVKVELSQSHGSGVHIGSGFILTAAHVVKDAKEADIKTDDGKSVKGEVLWSNTTYDVALIRVEGFSGASSALVCREPVTGEAITAQGNPMAVEFVQFWGRVAGKARTLGPWKNSIIMDISGGPGISGGPVFDEGGNVVAIFVGVALAPVGFGASFIGMSVGIPGTTICSLLAR